MAYVCTLSKELQEKAQKTLNEDPERRAEDIEHIRKWICEQPHLNIRTDDSFILRFLRGCKFDLEKTKEGIDRHYSIKTSLPQWFTKRDPQDPKLREIFKLGFAIPLKDYDVNGTKVLIIRQGCYDPEKFHIKDIIKAAYLLYDVLCEDDESMQVNGVGLLIDMKGVTFQHLLQYSPSIVMKALLMWQDGHVTENKFWTFLHASRWFHVFYNMLKIFMNDYIKKLIKLYDSDFKELYDTIPLKIWPKEYGGEGDSVDLANYWLEVVDSKRDWILEDEKNTVDETKRPKRVKN